MIGGCTDNGANAAALILWPLIRGDNVDPPTLLVEFNNAINQGENCKIRAESDAAPWTKLGADLTN